jgi:vitamin B12 transporter
MSPRFSPLLFLLSYLLSAAVPCAAQDQQPQRTSADVVVTAAAEPEPESTLGVSATVIGAEEIDRSRETSIGQFLRRVPGLDVVALGGPGTVTSLFLRGTGSNATLVLVDGVAVNAPFFGGVDLSTLATTNVERVEVVRGPFSALWGSDAIGGVVQIFTKRAEAPGLAATGTLGAGNGGAREGTLSAAFSEGALRATFGFRRVEYSGALPNDFFAGTNVSAALGAALGEAVSVGVTLRHDVGRTGIPMSGATPTPRRSTTADTTAIGVPIAVVLSAATTLELTGTWATDRPGYSDPDDPYGYTSDETRMERAGGRLVLSHHLGVQRLSLGAEWQRALVTDTDVYGTEIDARSVTTRALFFEDRVALSGEALVATVGLRRDDHSAFGGATSPRATLAWRVVPALKLRVAAGGAFRAPTVGELYYPYSGNPALRPERSVSFEAGADVTLAPRVTFSVTAFRNRVRDYIQYEFATGTNENAGSARMAGVETELTVALSERYFARAGYTWLDAWDETTSLPLLRRPAHRASVSLGATAWLASTWELTGLFVGRRDDVDAATFARVVDASYFRLDAAVTGPKLLEHLAPFVRVTNILGRDYAEAAGFPAPGSRVLGGLQASF